MALTLLEAAKRMTGDVFRQAVVEIYGRTTEVLGAVPFQTISGNAYKYNLEQTLPGVGFRGLNEGFSESTGILNPQTENLVMAGGDIDVDKFILRTMGQEQRAAQEALKIKSLAQNIADAFINGDSSTNSKSFDGLKRRIGGGQLIQNKKSDGSSTSGGDPLRATHLDELLDAVDDNGNRVLIMSKATRRIITQGARNTSVLGYVTYETDALGRKITRWNDVPILIADANSDLNQTIAFNEAATGGGTTATSIYCVALGDGYCFGLQSGEPLVTDIGELEAKPVLRTRLEWDVGLCLPHPRAAARLHSISNAAMVA